MKTRVFIVEDEYIHAEAIKIDLFEAGFDLAGECSDADSAFEKIKASVPDVVLIDIALPGKNNGITLAEKINHQLRIPHIFTTSFSDEEVVTEAIATKPSGYLHKPVDGITLAAAIRLAADNGNKSDRSENNNTVDSDMVFAKVGDRLVRINIGELLAVRADGENCIALVTAKKEILCRTTLKEFRRQLPSSFIQVHRSYYINLENLDSFNEREQTVYLKGYQAPVARGFRKAFLNSIHKV